MFAESILKKREKFEANALIWKLQKSLVFTMVTEMQLQNNELQK